MPPRTLSVGSGISGVPDISRRSFEIRPLGLKVLKAPTIEEWEALGHYLSVLHGALQFLIGDWLNVGEERFGEKASQAMDATGWDLETLVQYRRVAEQVPYNRRVPGLSFSHHREVGDLDADTADEWLSKAQSEGWSSNRLRRELNAVTRPESAKLWVLVECKDPDDQEKLLDRLKGEGRNAKAVER